MGTGTLTNRSAGQTILDTFFNDIHSALNSDFVGRNSAGVATSGQNLGTVAIPWGTVRAAALVLNGSSVDTSQITSVQNRVISGKTRSTSNQPAFITPNGAADSFIIYGSTTSLQLDINGSSVAVTTDISKTGLTLAPSSQNTCTINDADAASQDDTRIWGEFGHKKSMTVASMGTNITALVGRYATFKIGTEYFHAFVESSVKLSKMWRGYFYNSSLAPLNRTVFANSATVTLMSTGWVFVEDDGLTVDVSYRSPTYGKDSPSSPSTGDYWYDTDNLIWKRYDGASFNQIDRTLVGMVVMDATNCVAARCQDFYADYKNENGVTIEISTTEIVRSDQANTFCHVAGKRLNFYSYLPTWNITTDLATSADMYTATETASTFYYCYLTDEGDTVISDIHPYWRPDLKGYYHPHNPWRKVGGFYNNASSNITVVGDEVNFTELYMDTGNGHGAVNTKIRIISNVRRRAGVNVDYATTANAGDSHTIREAGMYKITYGDGHGAGTPIAGISVNGAALTTTIVDATYANGHRAWNQGPTNGEVACSIELMLFIGDIVRPHTGGGNNSTTSSCYFSICQTSKLAVA